MPVTRKAYAKINLFLDITGRRPDGYHTITGVMQSVSLYDTVTVDAGSCSPGEGGIFLTCTHPDLPCDRGNLGWRAAEAYLTAMSSSLGLEPARVRVTVHIDKHIPFAAGLAGGSTDAAAVLRGMNELYGFPLSPAELARLGLSLGADVPFCLTGGTARTEGVGECLTPLPALPDCSILIACAGEGVSTPAAYRALDEMYGRFVPGVYAPHTDALDSMLHALACGNLRGVGDTAFNLFESAVLPRHEAARTLRETMTQAGAVCARMSGSGPSVYGLFDGEAPCIETGGGSVFRCHPVQAY